MKKEAIRNIKPKKGKKEASEDKRAQKHRSVIPVEIETQTLLNRIRKKGISVYIMII